MGRRKEWLQRRTMIRSLLRTLHVSLKNISKGVLPVEWVRDLWDRIWEPRSLRREPPTPSRRTPPSRTRFWPDRSSWDPGHLHLASLLAWLRCVGSGIKFALVITINRNLSDISVVELVLYLFVHQTQLQVFLKLWQFKRIETTNCKRGASVQSHSMNHAASKDFKASLFQYSWQVSKSMGLNAITGNWLCAQTMSEY